MFKSILVVCTGNICRSPIGEHFLKQGLPNKIVTSAGTSALVGHAADSNAVKVANMHGISLDNHNARQFTASLAREYDLILVMEKSHIEDIGRISPESRGKTMLFGYWIGQKEIPDPYRKSEEAFFSVYQLIEQAGQRWIEKLNA
ncbi:protein tyrosine phosphatase [Klebsiella pneumoniae]|jgi:protein-tyrosine phosphatase|uniref:protein-tyrosine-phosphatase n=1 Tax=Klebsiella pneumoniae TaxID=573 RepID=A0A1C3T032_KLEPN|nr:protein tyrosine phosphatase [Klebsiella quasipneumoniae]MDW8792178.1 protein tyrosine phosphatase [Klebsiella pneumoniae]EKT8665491.1 protein tyrosine phosphatase [Klebsiella quasipneumoniae]MBC5534703.1 protein tyrosine phosphatase [Klebsiella quasipneumoniae]MBC5560727.1 protein tyrosine phosphatase [Klebsiella quasipneumoniae]MBY7166984.1 protein tyrosine phosphatase [Klebsiella quasipneumoniae]